MPTTDCGSPAATARPSASTTPRPGSCSRPTPSTPDSSTTSSRPRTRCTRPISNIQQLIVIPLGANGELPAPADATTIDLGGQIHYTDGFNANGITWARGWLIIVQSNVGLVYKVDPETGDGTEIELTGPAGEFLVTNG